MSVAFGHTSKIGKRVVVLGGGNTAMDCCRTAKRLGGEDVKVIVRSPFDTMKASPWEIEDAQNEDVEILNNHEYEITVKSFKRMIEEMTELLNAESGNVEMTFPYFVNKAAPVSGVESLMDYVVSFIGKIENGKPEVLVKVEVPVTSLCPCSKNISDYGAHNQRSRITACVEMNDFIWIEELLEVIEKVASCELYGLLKRPDEKYVTEKAYDNPKFVEDLVRDIAVDFYIDDRIAAYTVESENFESIHNHSAYAFIEKDKTKSKNNHLVQAYVKKHPEIARRLHPQYCGGRL